MGRLFMGAHIWLQFFSLLEKCTKWFEYILKMWLSCGCHKAAYDKQCQRKRKSRVKSVDAVAGESGTCLSSLQLARKGKLNYSPLALLNEMG